MAKKSGDEQGKLVSLFDRLNIGENNVDGRNIKLPGTDNKEAENINGDLNYMASVFGSIFYSETSINDWKNLKSKASANKIVSFKLMGGMLDSIVENIDLLKKDIKNDTPLFFSSFFSGNNSVKVTFDEQKPMIEGISVIKDTLDIIKGYLENKPNNVKEESKKTAVGDEQQQKKNIATIEFKNIEQFKSLPKETLNTLLTFFTELSDEDNNLADKIPIIQNNIAALNNIIVGNRDSLTTIIHNIELISRDVNSPEAQESLKVLHGFFLTLMMLTDITRSQRRRIESNIQYIKKFIVNDILDILEDLGKSADRVQRAVELNGPLNTIKDLFEAITMLVRIENMKRLRMKLNILWIRHFILKDIISIINDLQKAVKEHESDAWIALESLYKIIDSIIKVGDMGFIKLMKLSIKGEIISDIISDFITNIISALNNAKQTDLDGSSKKTSVLIALVNNINALFNTVPSIKTSVKTKLKLDTFIAILSILETLVNKINNIGTVDEKTLKKFDIKGGFSKAIDGLKEILDKFNTLDFSNINNLTQSAEKLGIFIMIISGTLLVASAAMQYINITDILKFTATLSIFLTSVGLTLRLFGKGFKEALQGAKDAIILITAASAILLAGGLIMQFIDQNDLVTFTITLSAFLFAIGGIFKLFSKGFETSLQGAEDAMTIVIGSAGILLLGSLIMKFIDPENLILFTVTLSAFLLAIGFVFKRFSAGFEKSMEGAQNAALLIVVSGALLIAASLIPGAVNILAALGFTLELGAFLTAISIVFYIFNDAFEDSMEGAADAAILIAVSGAILLAGGYIVKNNPEILLWSGIFAIILGAFIWGICKAFTVNNKATARAMAAAREVGILLVIAGALLLAGGAIIKGNWELIGYSVLFGIMLVAFIWGICKAFTSNNKNVAKAMASSVGVAILLVVAGAILLAGGAILQDNWEMIIASGLFAVILWTFIKGICKALTSNNKQIAMAIPTAIAMGILVVVTGAVLLAAGYVIKDKDMLGRILGFAAIATAFLYGLTGVLYLLKGIKLSDIWQGIVALAALEILCAGVAGIVWLLGKAFKEWDDAALKHVWDALKITAIIIGAVGIALAAIIGIAHIPVVGPILLAGAQGAMLFFAGLEALVWGLTKVMSGIAVAVKQWDNLDENTITASLGKMKIAISTYAEVGVMLIKSFGITGSAKLWVVSKVINSMNRTLSGIAKVMSQWAQLKIPEYTGMRQTGWITITDSDFVTAADNIKAVVTTLAQAIIDIYNEKPELFDYRSFLGFGESKFAKVVKSMKNMGKVLGSISRTMKDWASLKIPEYNGMKQVGWITITKGDFKTAGQNVADVIFALASGIINVYAKDKEEGTGIFESDHWFSSKTPFSRVVKSMKNLGPVLGSLAKGVKEWADLKIPVYGNNGKLLTYHTLSSAELGPNGKVSKNIMDTIIALSVPFTILAKDPVFDFKYEGGRFIGHSPAITMAKALGGIADVLNKTASIVYYYASGRFPIVEYKDGKLTMKLSDALDVKGNVLADAGENIKKVIVCMGQAMVDAIGQDKNGIFNGGQYSKANQAAVAIKTTADALKSIVTVIADINKMADIFKNDGAKLKEIKGNINKALATLMDIILIFGKPVQVTDADGKTTHNLENNKYTLFWGLYTTDRDRTLAETINRHNDDIVEAAKSIGNLSKSLKSIFESINTIVSSWNTNNKDNILSTFNESGAVTKMNTVMAGIIGIMVTINESYENNKKIVKKLSDDDGPIGKLNDTVKLLTDKKDGLLTRLYEMVKTFNENKLISDPKSEIFTKIGNFIKQYKDMLIKMSVLSGDKISGDSLTEVMLAKTSVEEMSNMLKSYIDILNGFVEIGNSVKAFNSKVSPFDILRKGISALYNVTSNIAFKDIQSFQSYTRTMDDFTTAINRIDRTNAQILINILAQLNKLSEKNAPLAQLAHAITDDLSAAYNKLTDKLSDVKKIMDVADQMQAKREKSIKNSIDNVKKLMEKSIEVNIHKIDTDMTQTYDSDTDLENSDDNTTAVKTGTGGGVTETQNGGKQTAGVQQSNKHTSRMTGRLSSVDGNVITDAIISALKQLNIKPKY